MHSINVTPLTDVLLVLLITFLLTAGSFQDGTMPMPLPRVSEARELAGKVVSVAVGRDGRVVWPRPEMGQAAVEQAFRLLRQESEPPTLALAVDRELSYQKLYPLLFAARQAGWGNIVLLTEASR